MKRSLIALILSMCSVSIYAFNWHDLWFTPNQQGQDLMAKSQYKEAKETFTRSDWAATAAYRAGNYQQAAELYQNLQDEQGYYNQGNSLAHMGQYEEAIKAYDKALAINSTNEDARYNRKIVEDLLKKDKEKKQSQDQQNKDKQNKDKQNKDKQNKDKQNKDKQNKDQQNKDQQNKDQQNKDQQKKDKQNKDQQNKDQQNKDQQNKDQKNKDQQDKEQQNQDQKDTNQQNKDSKDKDPKAKDQQKQKDKKNKQNNSMNNNSEAEREKQKAKEQWLRLIPDDPGGLLREKFLRDHLRRERGWEQ